MTESWGGEQSAKANKGNIIFDETQWKHRYHKKSEIIRPAPLCGAIPHCV